MARGGGGGGRDDYDEDFFAARSSSDASSSSTGGISYGKGAFSSNVWLGRGAVVLDIMSDRWTDQRTGSVSSARRGTLAFGTRHLSVFIHSFIHLHADERTLKAALWSVGHLATSAWGILHLVEKQLIGRIVLLAEESDSVPIRGTAFYALGLVASTRQGEREDHVWFDGG